MVFAVGGVVAVVVVADVAGAEQMLVRVVLAPDIQGTDPVVGSVGADVECMSWCFPVTWFVVLHSWVLLDEGYRRVLVNPVYCLLPSWSGVQNKPSMKMSMRILRVSCRRLFYLLLRGIKLGSLRVVCVDVIKVGSPRTGTVWVRSENNE